MVQVFSAFHLLPQPILVLPQRNWFQFPQIVVHTPPPLPFPPPLSNFISASKNREAGGNPPPPPPLEIEVFKFSEINLKKIDWKELLLINIPEDSIIRKIMACIPLIGIISTVYNERSLNKKIKKTEYSDQAIKLIFIKNHYKIASIIREMLTLALVITAISFNIFNGYAFTIGISTVLGMSTAYHGFALYKNFQSINKLKEKEFSEQTLKVY